MVLVKNFTLIICFQPFTDFSKINFKFPVINSHRNLILKSENTGYNDNKEINVKSTFLFLEYRIFKSKDIEA